MKHKQVTNELITLARGVVQGTIDTNKAKQAANAYGKAITNERGNLEFFALRKEKPPKGQYFG